MVLHKYKNANRGSHIFYASIAKPRDRLKNLLGVGLIPEEWDCHLPTLSPLQPHTADNHIEKP
jgi:hypothetical protein